MRMMVMDWLVVNSKSFEKEKKRSPNTNRLIKTTRKTVEKRGCWSIAARDSGERRRNTEVKKPRRRSQPASQLVCVSMTMANTDIISQPRWQLIEWLGELLVQTVVPPMMVVIVVVVVATIISKWTQWPPRVFAGRCYTGNTALTDEGERDLSLSTATAHTSPAAKLPVVKSPRDKFVVSEWVSELGHTAMTTTSPTLARWFCGQSLQINCHHQYFNSSFKKKREGQNSVRQSVE